MPSRALVGLAFALCGCASAQERERPSVESPGSPRSALDNPSDAPVVAVADDADAQRVLDPDDPCFDAESGLAELCAAATYDGGCVGYACARTDAREALECTLDRDTDPTRFVALTRAENPATRMYARAALLRLDAMTHDQIVLGLADTTVVEWRAGCLGDPLLASEPAYAALLQRDDPESDSLLREFLESRDGEALVFGRGLHHAGVRNATLSILLERSSRASWRGFPADYRERLRRAIAKGEGADHAAEPIAPSDALARWTYDHGCERDELSRRRAHEKEEKARLREVERELAASE